MPSVKKSIVLETARFDMNFASLNLSKPFMKRLDLDVDFLRLLGDAFSIKKGATLNMENKVFYYSRSSSPRQNENYQVDEALSLGIDERNIFIDKASGKNFERPQYQALKQCLRKGDLLYIHALSRLGRNRRMIRDEWKQLTQDIGIDIKVTTMPLLDTTLYKDKIGSFVNDLILEIFGYGAEEELDHIREFQRAGIDTAKKYGTKTGNPFGRPRVKMPEKFAEVTTRWKNNEITAVTAMKELNLSKPTFYKMVKENKIEKEKI